MGYLLLLCRLWPPSFPSLPAFLSAPGRLPFRGRLPFFPLIRPVYAWEHGFSLAVEDGIFLDFFSVPRSVFLTWKKGLSPKLITFVADHKRTIR